MYADEHKINEWNNSCCKIEERWRELSAHFKKENIACRELVLLVSFSLTLPGSNASVERIFSLMNSLWTHERNRLQLDTVQSILTIKTHYKHVSCSEFYEMISGDQKLLEKIHSSAKYCAISVQDIKEKKKKLKQKRHQRQHQHTQVINIEVREHGLVRKKTIV